MSTKGLRDHEAVMQINNTERSDEREEGEAADVVKEIKRAEERGGGTRGSFRRLL